MAYRQNNSVGPARLRAMGAQEEKKSFVIKRGVPNPNGFGASTVGQPNRAPYPGYRPNPVGPAANAQKQPIRVVHSYVKPADPPVVVPKEEPTPNPTQPEVSVTTPANKQSTDQGRLGTAQRQQKPVGNTDRFGSTQTNTFMTSELDTTNTAGEYAQLLQKRRSLEEKKAALERNIQEEVNKNNQLSDVKNLLMLGSSQEGGDCERIEDHS